MEEEAGGVDFGCLYDGTNEDDYAEIPVVNESNAQNSISMPSSETQPNEENAKLKTNPWEDPYYYFETWYPDLEAFTFPSVFLPITEKEAQALLSKSCFASFASFWKKDSSNPSMSDENDKIIEDLTNKLDGLIRPYNEKGGAFVRLSDRSPKDAVVNGINNRMHKIAKREIKLFTSTTETKSELKELNEDMIVFIRSCSKALKVRSGKEVMDLFLNSERIVQDLKKAIAYQHTLQFVVRQWANIDPIWEFRLFVMKGKLNGFTQYYEDCYVEEMWERKEEIERRIIDYWRKVSPHVKVDCYTIDFILDPQSENIHVMELNEPPPIASPALFNWYDKDDRKILEEGPYEYRIRKEPPSVEYITKKIPSRLLRILSNIREKEMERKKVK